MKIKQIDPEIIEAMQTVDYDFYEQPMLDFIATLGLTGTAIDVGAHVGNHTVYFATKCRFDHVIAFEPNPVAKHAFKENTAGLDNVTLIGKAVTDIPRYVSMRTNNGLSGQTQIINDEKSSILSTTIDHEIIPRQKVSLIKIDVEDREIDVIIGAYVTINRYKPHLFVEHFGNPNDLLQYLPQGYKVGQRFNGAPTYHYYYGE